MLDFQGRFTAFVALAASLLMATPYALADDEAPDSASARKLQAGLALEEGDYLHAEARSLLFRFVDDVEFLFDADKQVIHVRSASRTGYSDLGVNRRRVERIRRAFSNTP